MKDRWLVTLEIETYDGDPSLWAWDKLLLDDVSARAIKAEYKGRVLPDYVEEGK